jgi:hypothetical protein
MERMLMKVIALKAVLVVFLALCIGTATHSAAQTKRSPEYLVKAGFIYNFIRFVSWPPQSFEFDSSPIRVCVLGKNPFEGYLKTIESKTIRRREVKVAVFKQIGETKGCHVLYVSPSEMVRVPEIIRSVEHANVLTVGDMPWFTSQGGIINMIKSQNRIRFKINMKAVRRAGLEISAELLKLAIIVDENKD